MTTLIFSVIPPPSSSFLSQHKTLNPIVSSPTLTSRRGFPINCFRSAEPNLSSPAVQTFWQWLSDNGVVSSKTPAKPGIVPEGLGLIAQRDIGRNDVVLEVPKRFWINPDTVAASEIGSVCSGLKPWVSVALFLIREKMRSESSWRSYIDVLPECTNSTLFWSEEELSELQGTQLLSTTLGVKELVRNEFEKAEEEVLIPHKQLFPYNITYDDFFWAFGMLRSRAFTRLSGQSLVLIPLADLVNHSSDITTENYAYEIKGAGLFSREQLFSLRAPVPIKAGEQVNILQYFLILFLPMNSINQYKHLGYLRSDTLPNYYDPVISYIVQVCIQYDLKKSNAELALDYGFIESRSERNAYTLTLEIPESDPFFGDKLDIAETNGLSETAYFDITLGESLPPTMIPYLRLVALRDTDAFLLESIFRNSVWGHLELPVSRANEELICRVVRDACKAALSAYHTTIDEDEKLLEEEDLDPRKEIAIEIRLGEKKVLRQIDGIFEARESELNDLEYYQERRLKSLGLIGEEGDIIFWESN